MDENTNAQVETSESGFSEEENAAFDSGWDDSESPMFSEETEPEATQEPDAQPEDEADGFAEDEPDEQGEEPAEEADTEPEPEQQEEAGSQRYNLKFLGEERKVSFDEMREYAEKGMNYDHVKEERDALREKTKNIEELEAASTFLKELAESGGTSVEELMESTRARLLVQKAEAEGKELSEEDARAQVRAKNTKPDTPPAMTEEEKRQDAIQRFIQLYPGIKSESIPQSVWDEAERLGDLIGPYQKYESQKLRDEIATLKQNNKNRERSTGSRRTVGATTPKDAFEEGWDS